MQLADRYQCHSIAALFTREAFIQEWIRVESLASIVIDKGPFRVDETNLHFVLGHSLELEAEMGHDVAAFVESLRIDLAGPDGRSLAAHWLHWGLCSSDITDSAWTAQILKASDTLEDLSIRLLAEIAELPDYIELDARTHGQSAQPATLDAIRLSWHTRVDRAHARVIRARPHTGGGFRGPTSQGAIFGEDTSRQIQQILGFDTLPHGGQANPRDDFAGWVQAVAALASACEHVALQIRLWSQSGLAVVEEGHEGSPSDYRGSSSMPHKRNPTRSERICGIAPVIRGLAAGYAEVAASWWGEHSLEHSSADRIVIPQVAELTGYLLTETASLLHSSVWDDGAGKAIRAASARDTYWSRNLAVQDGVDPDVAYEGNR